MSLQKVSKRITLLAIISSILGGTSATSQTAESPNNQLYRLTEERNRIVAGERELSNFINQYTYLTSEFERSVVGFKDALARVEASIGTRSQGISEISAFINKSLETVMSPSSQAATVNRVWDEYRALRMRKNACDESGTAEAFIDLVNSGARIRAYHSSLSSLIVENKLPVEHRPILDQARRGLGTMGETAKQVEIAVDGYKSATAYPKVCELFRSFDIIVALALSAAEANEAAASIDKINIGQFLNAIDDANKVSQAVTTARRMMTSYEAGFIHSLRGGYLRKSIETVGNYSEAVDGIIKSLLESKQVSSTDKAELASKAEQTKSSIVREMEASKLSQVEGRRSLLLTRGRNLYASIGKIAKEATGPSADGKKKELLDYANTYLGMVFPGRYLVPQTPTAEAELALDGKFDKAEQLLLALGVK